MRMVQSFWMYAEEKESKKKQQKSLDDMLTIMVWLSKEDLLSVKKGEQHS